MVKPQQQLLVLTHNQGLLKIAKALTKTAGRDKILRVIQYSARLLAFFSKTSLVNSALFKYLTGEVSFVRRAFRFLKPLEHLANLGKVLDAKPGLSQWANGAREISFIVYLFFDHAVLFKRLRLLSPKSMPSAATWAAKFWAAAIGFGIVSELNKLYVTSNSLSLLNSGSKKKEKAIDEKNIKLLNEQQFSAQRKLVWHLLDFYVALNSSKILNSNEGSVAFAGVITSLLGLEDVIKSC